MHRLLVTNVRSFDRVERLLAGHYGLCEQMRVLFPFAFLGELFLIWTPPLILEQQTDLEVGARN